MNLVEAVKGGQWFRSRRQKWCSNSGEGAVQVYVMNEVRTLVLDGMYMQCRQNLRMVKCLFLS